MTDVLKQLVTTAANKLPSSTSDTTVYTVPGSTEAMLSRIIVANISANPASFRIAVVPSGGTVTDNYYWIAYDVTVGPGDSINIPIGAGMATGGFISVRTSVASVLVFSPYGIEVTP